MIEPKIFYRKGTEGLLTFFFFLYLKVFSLFFSRKDQNLLSPVNCWYLLLNQVCSMCLCVCVRLVYNNKYENFRDFPPTRPQPVFSRWGGRARITPPSVTSTWTTSSLASHTSVKTRPACWRGWADIYCSPKLLKHNELHSCSIFATKAHSCLF